MVTSIKTRQSIVTYGLADTGADSNMVPGGVEKILGCAVNQGVYNPVGGTGIGDQRVALWQHNLEIALLTPDRRSKAFVCPPMATDCGESRDHPLLLGTIGFLQYFKATFDHTQSTRILALEWSGLKHW